MGSLSPEVSEPEILCIKQSKRFDVESNSVMNSNSKGSDLAVLVQGACKEYQRGCPVLNQFNMRVKKGTIYGLLGSSGCGKTTILSCMVGLRHLDSGVIRVFGKKPGDPDSGIPGKAVGYMPQDIALFQTFRIKEILMYFGKLYDMTATQIKAETEFLINFLDLPDSNSLIKNLSGGEQRRTSLAIAMIFKPDLLILDEPTVGVDPLLRQSIWEHLKNLVATRGTTILITTHYIEEARESGTVGIMRDGRLLAEKSPQLLLEEHNAVLLETVVLKLCESDNSANTDLSDNNGSPSVVVSHDQPEIHSSHSVKRNSYSSHGILENLNSQITKVLSLTVKNYITLIRTPWFPMILILIPTIQLIIFNVILGNEPKHIPLGIVNNELPEHSRLNVLEFCQNQVDGCLSNFTSCKFLNKFREEDIKWVSYFSEEDALNAVQKGAVWGYLSIPFNYTTHIIDRVTQGKFSESKTLLGTTIGVKLDMSDTLKTTFIKQKLLSCLEEYGMQIASECGSDPRAVQAPLQFNSVFGKSKPGYIEFLQPAQLSLVIFLLPMLSVLTYLGDRKSGTLDRSMVAGVKHFHYLIAYMISEGSLIFIQLALSFAIYYLALDFSVKGSFLLYWAITYMQGIIGLSIGFFIAIVCDNEVEALLSIIAIYTPIMVSTGANWPLVGLSSWANVMCSLLPNTWPMDAMRSIISRAWGLSHPYVGRAFAIGCGWIIGVCLLCSIALRIKRN